MFLPPTIGELGLSQKRAADKNPRTSSVEHRNFLRKSQAQSQNRYVSKRDSAGAVGTPASGKKQPSITIRIAGGSNSGRLELLVDGTWGTICHNKFDGEAAYVACLQLGYSSATHKTATYFTFGGSGDGLPIVADDIRCSGNEDSLHKCKGQFGNHRCMHAQDVGIKCPRKTGHPKTVRLSPSSLGGVVPSPAREYKKDVDTTCGSEIGCTLHESELDIAPSGGNASPEGASLAWCKERCDASQPCAGFEFRAKEPSRCWFRRSTTCGRESDMPRDCYTKERVHEISTGQLEMFLDQKWGLACFKGFDDRAAAIG